MSDDETVLASEAPRRQGDLVLYDFFKYLTSLSLLMLGGILTLMQTPKGAELKLPGVIITMSVIAFAGVLSFAGAAEIARAHFEGDETKRLDALRKLTPVILSLGVGMFLFMFVKAL